jgi:hypothetical protein
MDRLLAFVRTMVSLRVLQNAESVFHPPRLLKLFRRFRGIAKSDYKLRHVCPSVCPSAWCNSAPAGRILMEVGS